MLVQVSHTDELASLEGGRRASLDCPASLMVKVTNIRVTAAKVTPRDGKARAGTFSPHAPLSQPPPLASLLYMQVYTQTVKTCMSMLLCISKRVGISGVCTHVYVSECVASERARVWVSVYI